jgi:hypothetical protein
MEVKLRSAGDTFHLVVRDRNAEVTLDLNTSVIFFSYFFSANSSCWDDHCPVAALSVFITMLPLDTFGELILCIWL